MSGLVAHSKDVPHHIEPKDEARQQPVDLARHVGLPSAAEGVNGHGAGEGGHQDDEVDLKTLNCSTLGRGSYGMVHICAREVVPICICTFI